MLRRPARSLISPRAHSRQSDHTPERRGAIRRNHHRDVPLRDRAPRPCVSSTGVHGCSMLYRLERFDGKPSSGHADHGDRLLPRRRQWLTPPHRKRGLHPASTAWAIRRGGCGNIAENCKHAQQTANIDRRGPQQRSHRPGSATRASALYATHWRISDGRVPAGWHAIDDGRP